MCDAPLPDATPDAPDLDALASLARAAKAVAPDLWTVQSRGAGYADYDMHCGWDVDGPEQTALKGMFAHRAVAEFIAAANPDTVLDLLSHIAVLEECIRDLRDPDDDDAEGDWI